MNNICTQCFYYVYMNIPFSPPGKKLVTIDNFSKVLYLLSTEDRLEAQDSTPILSFIFLPTSDSLAK
jgi:hypothetical protein